MELPKKQEKPVAVVKPFSVNGKELVYTAIIKEGNSSRGEVSRSSMVPDYPALECPHWWGGKHRWA